MRELLNSEILRIIIIILVCIFGAYLVGRAITKGFFKELDLYLGKKFTDHINNKSKQKEDGTKEKK